MVVQSVTDAPLCTTRCRLLLFRLHVRHALTFIDGDASYIALSLLLLIYMPWRHTLQPVIESTEQNREFRKFNEETRRAGGTCKL